MALPPPRGGAAGQRVEVADIFHAHGAAFRENHRLNSQQHRAMRAIAACRTPALGGQVEVCDQCGATRLRYHSCRNRHCPKCQTLAKQRWVEARQAELLPIAQYFHVVFTLPHALNPLAQGNPRRLYHLLFQSAAETLQAFAHNPRWLGGELGITMVLHTWSQTLDQHLHVHCLIMV
ncbi:MAG: IS91 family transposase [Gammaproteobacteria bacterium]